MAQDPVAYYPFNGDATDESGNGNDGNVRDGAFLTADRFGNSNSAYSFDGVDGNIELGNDPLLKPDFPATISIWINPGSSYSQGVVFANDIRNTTYHGLNLVQQNDGILYIGIGNGGAAGSAARKVLYSDMPIPLDSWTHVTAIWEDGSNFRIYINGIDRSGSYDDGTATTIDYTSEKAEYQAYCSKEMKRFGSVAC